MARWKSGPETALIDSDGMKCALILFKKRLYDIFVMLKLLAGCRVLEFQFFYSENIVKQKKYLALVLFPLFISPAFADPLASLIEAEPLVQPPAELQVDDEITATQRFADRCTDFTTNGWAFKAPRNFLTWLDVFTDPAIYLEFANRSLDPQSYVRTLSSMLDPGTPKNHLEWTNPEIYNQWAQAAAEPEYYEAVTHILVDPGRLMRWVMLPLDERVWSVVGMALNPNTLLKWINAPFDPKTQALLAKAANPDTSRLWLESLGNPENTPWFNQPGSSYSEQPVSLPKQIGLPDTATLKL
jgi:hypothetical protein